MQLLNRILGKTGLVGRLIIFSALGGVLVAAMVVPVVAATGIVVRNTADKFSTIAVDSDSLAQRSAIYDREGNLITYVWNVDLGSQMTYANGIDRQPVNYDQISPNMLTAIVAIEDDRFWQHGALDVKGTIRALVNDLEHKPIQGGSTLEQQYVKNVLVLQDLDNQAAQQAATADNLNRKLDQLRMAVQVAHTMTKQQILAGYLNDSYYGNGAWGIEAAAETYFNTTAAKLTMTQAATLAGIVENPTAYDPINNPATALTRRNTVLARIAATNPTALSAGGRQRPRWRRSSGCTPAPSRAAAPPARPARTPSSATTWSTTVLLDPQLGATTEDRAKLLSTGGLKIYTTLAPQDESAATHAVNYVVPCGDNYYNPNQNVDTTALVQPGTGKILAIAEDRQYGPNPNKGQTEVDYAVNSQYGGQDGVQTGSSSKLFTLLTALEQGVPFGYQATVQNSQTVPGFTNCAGDSLQPVPGRELQRQRQGHVHAVHRDGRLDQHLLRRARAEGRALQRRPHRGRPGHDQGGRHVAAQGDRTGNPEHRELPAPGRPDHLVHARVGQRVAAVDGRGLRDGGLGRHLLRADGDQQDHRRRRQVAAGAVGRLPPGAVE